MRYKRRNVKKKLKNEERKSLNFLLIIFHSKIFAKTKKKLKKEAEKKKTHSVGKSYLFIGIFNMYSKDIN